uniref:ClpN n=1 Tax=Spumella sp. Baekdong012001B8 TaxID=2782410 RepID=A0A7S6PVA4_9STRA|nr:ClpN [Spumella sp. Baekdong012001B8]
MQIRTKKFKISVSKQKTLEQRQKDFASSSLNLAVRSASAFAFFPHDVFTWLINAKFFAQKYKETLVNSEILLFSAIKLNLNVAKLYSTQTSAFATRGLQYSRSAKPTAATLFACSKHFRSILKKQPALPKFSAQCLSMLDKASENAKKRFSTSLVSATILFLTILEEKQLAAGKFLEVAHGSQLKWLMLRYRLLKRICKQEVIICNKLKRKHFYYLYLLSTLILTPKRVFLHKPEGLNKKMLAFRAAIIKQALQAKTLSITQKLVFKCLAGRAYLSNK